MPDTGYQRFTLAWQDFRLRERTSSLAGALDVGVPATIGALQACSNAQLTAWWGGPVTVTHNPPANNFPWYTCGYYMTFRLGTSGNDRCLLFFPAPITQDDAPRTTVLKSDLLSLDVSGVAMDFVAAAIASELNHPFTGDGIVDVFEGWVQYSSSQPQDTFLVLTDAVLYRRTVEWLDAAGNHFFTDLTSRAGAPDTQANLESISNATVLQWWEGLIVIPEAGIVYGDPYASVSQVARLYFDDETGTRTSIVIPSPKRSLFRPDGKTLNTGTFEVTSVIAAALSECIVPTTGKPFATYVGGYLELDRRYEQ